MRYLSYVLLISTCFVSCADEEEFNCAPENTIFQDRDGILIVEAESVGIPTSGWELRNSTAEYTGSGYLQWVDNNYFSTPGNGYISYQLLINNPGTYRFQWRSRINQGTSSTEHNDAWLRFPDADDFFAQKGESRLYPGGTGKSPNPNGQSKEGWFKIYQNQRDSWSWVAKTSDHDAHDVFVTFNDTGIYLMEISGRSTGFAIDRIVLHHESADKSIALDEDTAVSEQTCN